MNLMISIITIQPGWDKETSEEPAHKLRRNSHLIRTRGGMSPADLVTHSHHPKGQQTAAGPGSLAQCTHNNMV